MLLRSRDPFAYHRGMRNSLIVLTAFLGLSAVMASTGFCQGESSQVRDDSLTSMRTRLDAARARIGAQTALYHDPVGPRTWIDGSRLWYCETAKDGARRWWLVDARASGRKPLFDHEAASRIAVSAADGKGVAAERLPVRGVVVEGGMVVVSFESVERPAVFDLATGALVERSAEGDSDASKALRDALELRLRPGRARSRGQGPSSGIVFANRLDEEVELVWVDARGSERSYGRVAPRAERRQHTFGGHAWLVKSGDGERTIATPPNSLVLFEGALVEHKATPIGEGERRGVLSMTFATDPSNSLLQGVARRIKDTAFFGIRALWT